MSPPAASGRKGPLFLICAKGAVWTNVCSGSGAPSVPRQGLQDWTLCSLLPPALSTELDHNQAQETWSQLQSHREVLPTACNATRASSKASETPVPRVGPAGAVWDPLGGRGGVPARPTPSRTPAPKHPAEPWIPAVLGLCQAVSHPSLTSALMWKDRRGAAAPQTSSSPNRKPPQPPALPRFLRGTEVLSTAFSFRRQGPWEL